MHFLNALEQAQTQVESNSVDFTEEMVHPYAKTYQALQPAEQYAHIMAREKAWRMVFTMRVIAPLFRNNKVWGGYRGFFPVFSCFARFVMDTSG